MIIYLDAAAIRKMYNETKWQRSDSHAVHVSDEGVVTIAAMMSNGDILGRPREVFDPKKKAAELNLASDMCAKQIDFLQNQVSTGKMSVNEVRSTVFSVNPEDAKHVE